MLTQDPALLVIIRAIPARGQVATNAPIAGSRILELRIPQTNARILVPGQSIHFLGYAITALRCLGAPAARKGSAQG